MVRSEREDRILVTKSLAALNARSASTYVRGMLETRGVQRPLHPILSIGARASGGPEKGPCIVKKIVLKNL